MFLCLRSHLHSLYFMKTSFSTDSEGSSVQTFYNTGGVGERVRSTCGWWGGDIRDLHRNSSEMTVLFEHFDINGNIVSNGLAIKEIMRLCERTVVHFYNSTGHSRSTVLVEQPQVTAVCDIPHWYYCTRTV